MKHFSLLFTTWLRPAWHGLLLLLVLLGAAGAARAQTANSAITGISPTSGPVGTRVTIQGVDLLTASSVRFGNIVFPVTNTTSTFVSRNNETLVVDVPAGAATGPVFAVFEEGSRQGPVFTVTSGLPTLTSIAPARAPVGATIVLNGSGLTGTTTITFPKSPTNLTNNNLVTTGFTVNAAGTQITGIVVPAGAVTGLLNVQTPRGPSNEVRFELQTAAVLFSLTPNTGPVGTSITIQGSNTSSQLEGVTGVSFNGTPATVFSTGNGLTATATVPAGATSGNVIVTTAAGPSNGLAFTVTAPLPVLPVLASIAPAAAPIGGTVVLNGTGLTGTSVITFDKSPFVPAGPGNLVTSGYTVNAAGTQITGIVVPSGAVSGTVFVTTPNGQSNTVFFSLLRRVQLNPPVPGFGLAGTVVTLSSSNGNMAGITAVSFNGTPATVFAASNDFTATATVPAGATSGLLTVTNAAGVSNGVQFTVSAVGLPALISIAPTAAPRGATVTLNGTNLTGTSSIRFANDFTSPPNSNFVTTGFTVNAAGTQITGIVVPVGAVSGGVSVVAGGESNTVNFTVIRPVVLNAPNPTSGLVGSNVTLTSANGFMSGITAVRFNGVLATVFASPNDFTATAVVPGGATSGPITVTNAAGVSNGVPFTITSVAVETDLVVLGGTQKRIDGSTPAAERSYRDITVERDGELAISGVELRGSRAVRVLPGGRLFFLDGATLAGAATFTLSEETGLYIGDVAGISASGNTGSIRTTGARSFSSAATYEYAEAARATGSGLPGTVARLRILTDENVTLTAPVAVSQEVVTNAADLELDGKALTLLSSASGTALVANFGSGIVRGTTGTMQRYIGTNTTGSGYRHYSSPVQAETFATLAAGAYVPNFSGAAEYNLSATPGRVTPFPTVFGYSQDRIAGSPSNYSTFDKGWEAATGGNEPMTVGRGYAVQAPGSILVDFTGQFTAGIFTRDGLRRSPDAQGSTVGTGWHLLGNPYPSPIDWNTMRIGEDEGANLQRLDAAMYVVQSSGPYTGTYRTYLAQAPNDESSSPIIPAGQGFFVRTSSPAAAGAIRLTNENRVTTFAAGPAFGRGPNDERPIVRLSLDNAAGTSTDQLTLYADAQATAGVDARYDATKLGNPSGLNLSAVAPSGEALAIDGRSGFAAATAVALRLSVPADGTYTLRAVRVANLPAGLVAYLHDAATGQQVSLAAQPTLALTLAAGLSTRYSVVFAAANVLSSAPALTAAQVVLYPNPAGTAASVTVTLPAAAGTRAARATVLNALGQVVAETVLTVQSGQASGRIRTAGLAAGVYVVRLQAGAQVVSKRLVVE